ncbi:MAG: oligosaccharide flippase family protein [Steroidobacteraceae bacterium]|nr:oligosaccharide flippase family protein [Nevskiaceae bacterium]
MSLYSRERTRRSLFATVGYRSISQVATVLSYVVLVRGISEESFGVYSLLYSFVTILTTFGSLGLDQTLKRYQPEFLSKGQGRLANALVRLVRRARFASNVLLILLVILGWRWIGSWFGLEEHLPDFLLFATVLLLYFQTNILQFALSANMLHQYSIGSIAVISVTKLVAYSALSLSGSLTLQWAIGADLIAYGLAYAFLAIMYRRRVVSQAGGTVDALPDGERSRLTRYATYNHFNDSASVLVYSETDRFFLAAMLNPLAVGTYAFYTRMTEMLSSLVPTTLFDSLIQPLMFSVKLSEAREKLPKYFTLLLNMNLAYHLPVLVFSIVCHREIVDFVFGGKFQQYSSLLPLVVAMATTGNVFAVPITIVAQYQEKARLILFSEIFGLYQVLAMLVLIPALGLYGAALSTGSFHLLRNLFVWWNVRDLARWTSWRSTIMSALFVWGATLAIGWVVTTWLSLPPLLDLILVGLLCALAALVYFRAPGLCATDRELIGNVMQGREARLLRLAGILAPASGA